MSRGRLRYVTFNSRGGIMGINLSVQLSKKTPKIKATLPAPSNAIVAGLSLIPTWDRYFVQHGSTYIRSGSD
jgi:hypothetical protein